MQAKEYSRPEILIKAGVVLAMGAVGFGIMIPASMDLVTQQQNQQHLQSNRAMQAELVETLAAKLERHYVDADTARAMAALLRVRQREKRYAVITSPRQLASVVTDDLQSVSGDRQLQVSFHAAAVPEEAPSAGAAATDEGWAALRWRDSLGHALERLGVRHALRFKSNIGYVELTHFADAALARRKYAGVMEKMADTRALILDLRKTGGGDREAMLLLASYFFDAPVHFADTWHREGARSVASWTRATVPGPRYASRKKLVILTGPATAAAAEEFAYNMQQLKRATIVGQLTRGAAHRGRLRRVGRHFSAFIPDARSTSPITHANWAGDGVAPDIYAPARLAPGTAQERILQGRLP